MVGLWGLNCGRQQVLRPAPLAPEPSEMRGVAFQSGTATERGEIAIAERTRAGLHVWALVSHRLGPYSLVRQLGSGAGGVVYEAIDAERSLRVALKTLPAFDAAAGQQLKNEFRNVATIHHRNLVRLYELVESDGQWFFTMELLRGRQFLEDLVHRTQGLAAGERFEVLRHAFGQLAEAVETLHQRELLHLDLKPANILVEPDGRVVLLDFGIARRFLRAGPSSALSGTASYMSPEQLRRKLPGPASDWYSFGLLLFEALTGALPWDDPWDALEPGAPKPRPSAVRTDVPADLDQLCAALLAGDPSARPAGGEVLSCLGSAVPPTERQRRLVGRAPHLQALTAAVEELVAGKTMLIRLTGASGVGKSALADAFLDALRRDGRTRVLAGRCYEWESAAYKGLDSALEGLADQLGDAGALMSPEEWSAVAQLFPSFGRTVKSRPRAPGAHLDDRARAFLALKKLLAVSSERAPLVLFLDDVHWGDVDGARLLVELLSPPQVPRMLVVVAHRPDEAGPFVNVLDEPDALRLYEERRIAVEALSPEDSTELARELLEGADDSRGRQIAAEAGGNPLFIQQLARHESAGPPALLDEVVRARVSRLPAQTQRVLEVIAVAGKLPEQDLALAAAGASADPHHVLSALRAASLVRTRGPRRADAVELYHDRIRQCLLRGLEPSTRRQIHQSLVDALEQRGGADPFVLSTHHEGAGSLAAASRCAAQAAEAADAKLAFELAAELYQRALRLDGARPDKASVLEQLGKALFNGGRGAEAGPRFLEAAALADAGQRPELRRLAVESLLTSGRLREGLAALEPLARENKLPFHSAQWRATTSIATELIRLRLSGVEPALEGGPRAPHEAFEVDLCWTIGRGLSAVLPTQGVDFLFRGLNRALKLGDPRRLVRALTMQGSALVTLGGPLRRLGEDCLKRAEDLAETSGDPYLRGTVLVFKGFSEVAGAGRWGVARSQAEEGMRLLRAHCTGVAWELDMAQSVRFKASEPSGDVSQLGEEARQWARDAADRGDLYTQNVAASFVVPHLLALDDTAGAKLHARRLLEPWSGTGYTVQHYHATRLETLCDLYTNQAAEAWARFQREWPEMQKLHIHRLTLSRLEVRALEASMRLTLAAAGVDRARHLGKARKLGQLLGKELRVDGPLHASMILGCIALLERERDHGVALLEASREGYAAAEMAQWSWAVERRLAEHAEDAARLAAADAWFRARGVTRPEAWVAQFLPSLRQSRA